MQLCILISLNAMMYFYTFNNLGISVLLCFENVKLLVLVNEEVKMLKQFEEIGFIFK